MKRIAWIAAVVILSGGARNASAFTLLNGVEPWLSPKITYDIDSSCAPWMETVRSALETSMNVWNNVASSSLELSLGSTVTLEGTVPEYIGAASSKMYVGNPTVICDTAFVADTATAEGEAAAMATITSVINGTHIAGALLILNYQSDDPANISGLPELDVTAILAHEMGHTLGLGHAKDQNSIMWYAAQHKVAARLSLDDLNGVTFLYPRKDFGFIGCSTVQVGSGQVPGPWERMEIFLVWSILVLVWRVSRASARSSCLTQ